jgi:hypothetical protein
LITIMLNETRGEIGCTVHSQGLICTSYTRFPLCGTSSQTTAHMGRYNFAPIISNAILEYHCRSVAEKHIRTRQDLHRHKQASRFSRHKIYRAADKKVRVGAQKGRKRLRGHDVGCIYSLRTMTLTWIVSDVDVAFTVSASLSKSDITGLHDSLKSPFYRRKTCINLHDAFRNRVMPMERSYHKVIPWPYLYL